MSITQNIIDALKIQEISPDSLQLDLIKKLENLEFKKGLSKSIKKFVTNDNLGIYIWGDVGRGKTLITDQYLKQLNKEDYKSFHYIDLMDFVHNELNINSGRKDPLNAVTRNLVRKCSLISIDEFQVEDVSDAMIIGNLLIKILESGTKIIITSNSHPNDLYKDGLQRQKFIESIMICTKKLEIFKLDGEIDYRLRNIIDVGHDKQNIYSEKDILNLIKENFIFSNHHNKEITINKRIFNCKLSSNNILWIEFMVFFKEPTGTKDYNSICDRLDWIFINNFESCDDDSIDIVRRFISFIDIAYTKKTKVKFFFNHVDVKNIYVGEKLQLLWSRCSSRLTEMQNYGYLSDD
tara:strand:- start:30 stop:1079 length:1050 start_codon:yes stop_codon:yes gene_type:complete